MRKISSRASSHPMSLSYIIFFSTALLVRKWSTNCKRIPCFGNICCLVALRKKGIVANSDPNKWTLFCLVDQQKIGHKTLLFFCRERDAHNCTYLFLGQEDIPFPEVRFEKRQTQCEGFWRWVHINGNLIKNHRRFSHKFPFQWVTIEAEAFEWSCSKKPSSSSQ